MSLLLWIDPGMSTGIALGTYSDDQPYTLEGTWQVGGGLRGLVEWWDSDAPGEVEMLYLGEIGVEKFTPRPHAGGGGLTLKTVEPLRIEGWLVGNRLIEDYPLDGSSAPPQWQHPPLQYFAGGKTVAEKKKRQHAWLKEHGLYVTGKDVGQPNADDARSAIAHSIAFLRKFHRPTQGHYFREG